MGGKYSHILKDVRVQFDRKAKYNSIIYNLKYQLLSTDSLSVENHQSPIFRGINFQFYLLTTFSTVK